MSAESSTKALVETIRAALPSGHEWDERELALLPLAEAQAADIDRLEADLAEQGVRIPARGGERLNTALAEVRQGRAALARILGGIDIPESVGTASLHGKKAAAARLEGGELSAAPHRPRHPARGFD
jgi:hypothetical protein